MKILRIYDPVGGTPGFYDRVVKVRKQGCSESGWAVLLLHFTTA